MFVPAVWAGRKISYLIDQIRAHGESQEMIAEIVQLSQSYGIQTPYTSWLVAPEGEQQIVWRHGRRGGPVVVPSLPPAARESMRRGAPGKGGGGGGFGGGGRRRKTIVRRR